MFFDAIENAQRVLRALAEYVGAIDGDPGVLSLAAADRVMGARAFGSRPVTPDRVVVAAAQLLLARAGFGAGPIDGFYGPSTDAAYEAWRTHGRGDAAFQRVDNFGTEAGIVRRFGAPGAAICTAGRVEIPWGARLAWDQSQKISGFACHADVASAMQGALNSVSDVYSGDEIRALGFDQFGGCFNDRLKRGGRTKSTHAWGIATDWDPARNRLSWDKPRARLSHDDASEWWRVWSEAGFTGLGPARGFDWMHIQAVRP